MAWNDTDRGSGQIGLLPSIAHRRRVAVYRIAGALGLLFIAATGALGRHYRVVPPSGDAGFAVIRDESWPSPGARVMVVAPHPDDETLGGEMVLRAAARNHSPAEVIVVTCGDAFRMAATAAFGHRARPADMLALGRLRQAETLHAMRALGLKESQVRFLGFPDGGLASLWAVNWDRSNPYTSPSTGMNRCLYPRCLVPGAPYSGEVLLKELVQEIAAFRPTDIYVPHAWDYHPDHAATNYFVMTALHALASNRFARGLRIHPYLVHCGDGFPTPRAYLPRFYVNPPAALRNNGLTWTELPLTPGQVVYRLHLIDLYTSQVALTRPFLESFARRDVLFGYVPRFYPRSVSWGPGAARWTAKDTFYRRAASNDLNAVVRESAVWCPHGLLVRIQATVPAKGTVCRLVLHPLLKPTPAAPVVTQYNPGTRIKTPVRADSLDTVLDRILADDVGHVNIPGVERTDAGDIITLLLPRTLFRYSDQAYLDVTLIHNHHLVKSTPWRAVAVPHRARLPVI